MVAKHATALRAGEQVQDTADCERPCGGVPSAGGCLCHSVSLVADPNQG